MQLYKVLVDLKSCHGGDMTWTPGAWHEVAGELEMCSHGLHLTSDPAQWWVAGASVWPVEAEEVQGDPARDDRKVVSRRVRLGDRPLTDDELVALRIYSFGEHTVREGHAVAWGSSRVVAWDSSSVVAWDSSSVEALDSSSVEARGSSRVVAWDSSSVVARGSSSVVARGSSRVVALDSSRVVAWDSSSVEALDSSSVEARGSSRVVAWDSSNLILYAGSATLHERAAGIDRRNGKPTLLVATESV